MVYTTIEKIYGVILSAQETMDTFKEITTQLIKEFEEANSGNPIDVTDREFLAELPYDVNQYLSGLSRQDLGDPHRYTVSLDTFPCCSKNNGKLFVFGVRQNGDLADEIMNGPFTAASLVVTEEMKEYYERFMEQFPSLGDKPRQCVLMLDDCTRCS